MAGLGGYLIGTGHMRIEDVKRNAHKRRVRHPGPVVPVPHLTLLVRPHLVQALSLVSGSVITGRKGLPADHGCAAGHGYLALPVATWFLSTTWC